MVDYPSFRGEASTSTLLYDVDDYVEETTSSSIHALETSNSLYLYNIDDDMEGIATNSISQNVNEASLENDFTQIKPSSSLDGPTTIDNDVGQSSSTNLSAMEHTDDTTLDDRVPPPTVLPPLMVVPVPLPTNINSIPSGGGTVPSAVDTNAIGSAINNNTVGNIDALVATMSQDTKDALLKLFFANKSNLLTETNQNANDMNSGDNENSTTKRNNNKGYSNRSSDESILSMTISPSLGTQSQTASTTKDRPIVYDGAYFTAAYLACIIGAMGFAVYRTITKTLDDHHYLRLIVLLFYPIFFCLSLFPFRIAIYNILALFGSWKNVYKNSKYHSATLPPKIPSNETLPTVCVQMPIYKESFTDTIQPSLDSIRDAIMYYRENGGEAYIFVNDDGLQLLSEEERQERINYYNEHQIAYVARPAHDILPRHGIFKKASNMNFCLNFAMEVAEQNNTNRSISSNVMTNELSGHHANKHQDNRPLADDTSITDHPDDTSNPTDISEQDILPISPNVQTVENIQRRRSSQVLNIDSDDDIDVDDEIDIDDDKDDVTSTRSSEQDQSNATSTLDTVIQRRNYPVLAGGPIERIEQLEYILLVDSDTRVPASCLYDTVGELVYDPTIAFIQHATTAIRVDDNYWENMIAHFIHLLYSVFIPINTALGEPSPFVGHNATLNWKAIQDVSWYDDKVRYRKYWSESHVSEDFDLMMRFQCAGYIGRYALYTGDEFKEGVSLTVHAEIKKLRKFAFGAGEMIFNPLKDWPCKGPISPFFRTYVTTSSVPWFARVNMVAYLFTYIAMGYGVVAIPLSFYIGFLDAYDLNMPSAWQLMIGTYLVFGALGTIFVVLLSFFLGHHQSLSIALLYEVSKLIPLLIFFTGVQYHVCTSLGRYTFSMKAEWGATVKELDKTLCHYNFTTFVREVMKTIRAYWDCYFWLSVMIAFFVYFFLYLGPEIDVQWSGWAASPLLLFMFGHAMMPIVLNPTAMRSFNDSLHRLAYYCCCCCISCSDRRIVHPSENPMNDDTENDNVDDNIPIGDDAIPTNIVEMGNDDDSFNV